MMGMVMRVFAGVLAVAGVAAATTTGASGADKPAFAALLKDVPSSPYLTQSTRTIECRKLYPFALAGGYSFSGVSEPRPQPNGGVAVATAPVGDRKWALTDFNHVPAFGNGPRLYVLCSSADPEYAVRKARVTIGPEATDAVSARCKGRDRAVSAGWSIAGYGSPGGAEILVARSRRVGDRRWNLVATNLGDAPGTLKLLLNCSSRTPALREVASTVPVQEGFSNYVDPSVECPGRRLAFSGGFDAVSESGAPIGYGYGTYPARGWSTLVAGLDGIGDAQTARIYAYCGAPKIDQR